MILILWQQFYSELLIILKSVKLLISEVNKSKKKMYHFGKEMKPNATILFIQLTFKVLKEICEKIILLYYLY